MRMNQLAPEQTVASATKPIADISMNRIRDRRMI
jgi:hypothetical protein